MDRFEFGVLQDTGGKDRVLDFQVGVDKLVIGQLDGGGTPLPAIELDVLADGRTLVTVGDAASPLFEIAILTTSGTLAQSDILFSFNG